jgi:hypothetical protein
MKKQHAAAKIVVAIVALTLVATALAGNDKKTTTTSTATTPVVHAASDPAACSTLSADINTFGASFATLTSDVGSGSMQSIAQDAAPVLVDIETLQADAQKLQDEATSAGDLRSLAKFQSVNRDVREMVQELQAGEIDQALATITAATPHLGVVTKDGGVRELDICR